MPQGMNNSVFPVVTVRLNRPDQMNAMNLAMWHDIRTAFEHVDATPEIRVAILEGEGKAFTAGIDLQMMMGLGQQIQDPCEVRVRETLRRLIQDLQDTLTSLERCRKPVLAAVSSKTRMIVEPICCWPRTGGRGRCSCCSANSCM